MTKKEGLSNEHADIRKTKDRREVEIVYEAYLAGWEAKEQHTLDVPHPMVIAHNGYLITPEEMEDYLKHCQDCKHGQPTENIGEWECKKPKKATTCIHTKPDCTPFADISPMEMRVAMTERGKTAFRLSCENNFDGECAYISGEGQCKTWCNSSKCVWYNEFMKYFGI